MGDTTSNPHFPVPLELASEIFTYVIEDYKAHVRKAMDKMAPPFDTPPISRLVIKHKRDEDIIVTLGMLSQVCQSWKEVVYNTAVLWDTVLVDLKGFPQDDTTISDAMVKLRRWINRAGNRRLTVKIEGDERVQKTLLEYSTQWKHIDICCFTNHPELHMELQEIMRSPPARLESFVYRPPLDFTTYPHHLRLEFPGTPALNDIASFPFFPVVLGDLSHIKVCKWVQKRYHEIIPELESMENLKDCYIYSPSESLRWPPRTTNPNNLPQRIRLHHLENFVVWTACARPFPLLDSLEFPVLRRFTFLVFGESMVTRATVIGWSDILRKICSFLLRSNSPYVQILEIEVPVSSTEINLEDYLDMLRLVPNLEQFNFTLQGFDESPVFIRDQDSSLKPGLITLDRLESYHINLICVEEDRSETNTVAGLLKYLTFPALKKFKIVLPAQKEAFIIAYTATLDLLYRSSNSLTTVKINTQNHISIPDLINALKGRSTLECLHLIGQNYNRDDQSEVKFEITNDLFEFLLPRPRSQIHLPRLSELSYEGKLVAEEDVIFSALGYRWIGDAEHAVSKLSRFRLYTSQFMKLIEDQRYQDLVKHGMDIKFDNSSSIEEDMDSFSY